jgi:hypothetical protein
MLRNLFNTTIGLIFKPSEAWKNLRAKRTDDYESFLSDYIYPYMGMIAVAAFVGVLFTRKEFDFQIALKTSILEFLSAFGGFFLASYILNELWRTFFHQESDMKLCRSFVGYASSLMFALTIIESLLPAIFFLGFFSLYTIYIVWEGAVPYMEVKESDQFRFVTIATIIILLTPIVIHFILRLLMPGLR